MRRQFENGVPGSIHLDGLSIDVGQPQALIYGTKGIKTLGDCSTFSTSVSMMFPSGGKFDIPLLHRARRLRESRC